MLSIPYQTLEQMVHRANADNMLTNVINMADLLLAELVGAATELTNGAIPGMYSIKVLNQSELILKFWAATGLNTLYGTVGALKDALLTPVYVDMQNTGENIKSIGRILVEFGNDMVKVVVSAFISGIINVVPSLIELGMKQLQSLVGKFSFMPGISAFLNSTAFAMGSSIISGTGITAMGDHIDDDYDPNNNYNPPSRGTNYVIWF